MGRLSVASTISPSEREKLLESIPTLSNSDLVIRSPMSWRNMTRMIFRDRSFSSVWALMPTGEKEADVYRRNHFRRRADHIAVGCRAGLDRGR